MNNNQTSSNTFVIKTTRTDRPVSGFDSVIVKVGREMYLLTDGEPVFFINRVSRWLRNISEMGAAGIDEELHHADWFLTSNPDQVMTKGLMHECPSCRAGVEQAVGQMKAEPGTIMAVGQLYWAG